MADEADAVDEVDDRDSSSLSRLSSRAVSARPSRGSSTDSSRASRASDIVTFVAIPVISPTVARVDNMVVGTVVDFEAEHAVDRLVAAASLDEEAHGWALWQPWMRTQRFSNR